MKKYLLAALFSLVGCSAFAACPTPITVKDAAGTTQNMTTVDDGSGNCIGASIIFDAAGVNKLAVNGSGQAAIQAPPSLPLPTGAATSANQGSPTDNPCTLPATATSCPEIDVLKAIANAANSPPPLGTASGWTPKLLNALSTTVTAIKSSAAGQLGLLQCGNTNASEGYVQVFDVATAGAVTLGTTTPKLSIPIAATNTGGWALPLVGMQFANGIQVAATTTATGLTALGTALDCNAAFN